MRKLSLLLPSGCHICHPESTFWKLPGCRGSRGLVSDSWRDPLCNQLRQSNRAKRPISKPPPHPPEASASKIVSRSLPKPPRQGMGEAESHPGPVKSHLCVGERMGMDLARKAWWLGDPLYHFCFPRWKSISLGTPVYQGQSYLLCCS